MTTIEIVSHCYASVHPHYAWALRYQLSSLLDEPEHCEVVISIFCDPDDQETHNVIDDFEGELGTTVFSLPLSRLGRRAIGRNIAARTTAADIVWFSDVDQVFREGILDRLAQMEWPEEASMIYPKEIMIHKDHEMGDKALKLADGIEECLDVNPSEFIPKRYKKAIGGVQIVKGEFAREHGYLKDHPKWQKPTDGTFQPCRCDVAYRKYTQQFGRIVGVDLPGLYRLRHTEAAHGRQVRL